uniref:C2H2-type domain-containing protein n=1 Tax=Plectus sambesii TaxID=2011161 RepID=A0A914V5B9_9BILA
MARYTVQSLHETHVQSSASSPATLTLSLTDQMTTDEACASDSKMPDIFMADGDNCYVPLIIIPDVNQGGEYDNDGVQFRCPVCSQGCPSRSKLEVHFRTHTDERPFECHQCGQSFRTQSSLIRHRKTHTDELQYACQEEDCERRFKFSGDLSRHMRTMHSEQRRFSCNFCTAKFKTNERCREHIRSHIPGQKPYRCSLCPMSFVNSSKLRIHTRTHTGDKPFRCKEKDCDAAFVDSAGLVKHRRTHLPKDVMLYWCEVCGKGYRHSPTLGKHRRT